MDIALVLGSGGARGYAHIGVIDELLDRGHRIVSVAGCSMGSLIGGLYAAGALDEFRDFTLTLRRTDVFRLADITVSGPGLFKTTRLMDRLHGMIGDVRIEDLPIPYTAVATDLTNHREVWFHDGPLLTAIRASIAIPTAITPVVFRDRLLADGGILNPLPLDASSHFISDATVAVSLFGRDRFGVEPQAAGADQAGSDTGNLPDDVDPRDREQSVTKGVAHPVSEPPSRREEPAADPGRAAQAAQEAAAEVVAESETRAEIVDDLLLPEATAATSEAAAVPGAVAGWWRERVAQPWKPSTGVRKSRTPEERGREAKARGPRKSAEWNEQFASLPKDLSTVDMMLTSLEIMQAAIEKPRIAIQPPDVLVSVPADTCATFDFDQASRVIATGRALAKEALDRAGL